MPTITSTIVNVNATLAVSPTPSQLQRSGAIVSVGGTSLTIGEYQYCGNLATLESLLLTTGPGNYAEILKMATTFFAQGTSVGVFLLELGYDADIDNQIGLLDDWRTLNPDVFYAYLEPLSWDSAKDQVGNVIISANTAVYTTAPTVTFSAATGAGRTATGTTTINTAGALVRVNMTDVGYYPNQTAPTVTLGHPDSGTGVSSVTVTPNDGVYGTAPTVTFSAATGNGVTATGHATTDGSDHLLAVVIDTPGNYPNQDAPTVTFSSPDSGTGGTGVVVMSSPSASVVMQNALAIMANNDSSPTGKTYHFVTTSYSNLASYSPYKSVIAVVPSPTATSDEWQAGSFFYQFLNNNPGSANRLAPLSYRYVYGTTPWEFKSNQISITNILSGYGNIILTGAEGGISNACIFKGMCMDGTQASNWYGVDWFQIQVKQALAAAIINGSNRQPPLLYNQEGINTLQKVAQQVANNAVTFGCLLSGVVEATPFGQYTTENPNLYGAGQYDGFSATVVGQNGFLTITFNLGIYQFVV